jgi:hypothetical protein
LDDIILYTKTGIKSSNTYNDLFSINEHGQPSLGIFSPLKPKINESNLKFITGEVNLHMLGINSSPQQILQLWEDYEQNGFPLEDIAQSLYTIELREFFRVCYKPIATLLAEVVVLLDSINKCKQIVAFSKRVSQDKRKLLNLIEARNKDKENIQKNLGL